MSVERLDVSVRMKRTKKRGGQGPSVPQGGAMRSGASKAPNTRGIESPPSIRRELSTRASRRGIFGIPSKLASSSISGRHWGRVVRLEDLLDLAVVLRDGPFLLPPLPAGASVPVRCEGGKEEKEEKA